LRSNSLILEKCQLAVDSRRSPAERAVKDK
jgi:hypothetical protein